MKTPYNWSILLNFTAVSLTHVNGLSHVWSNDPFFIIQTLQRLLGLAIHFKIPYSWSGTFRIEFDVCDAQIWALMRKFGHLL
jgi:hypothetical protein